MTLSKQLHRIDQSLRYASKQGDTDKRPREHELQGRGSGLFALHDYLL
jgi:hypothetical protein